MTPASASLPTDFPHRIGRRLSLAFSIVIAVVLLVGGISIFLTQRIFQNQRVATQESTHMVALDRIHFLYDDLIFEVRGLEATGQPERLGEVRSRHADLVRQLEFFRDLHRAEEGWEWQVYEEAGFTALWQMAEELQPLTRLDPATLSPARRLTAGTPDRLSVMTHEVPVKIEALNDLHRLRATEREQDSQRLLQGILALYVVFTVAGGGLIFATSLLFRRRVAVPLRTLSEAALAIGEGRMDQRIPLGSRDEFGQVARVFNLMAERVETREREIEYLNTGLQDRVLERTRDLQERTRELEERTSELEETLRRLTSAQEALARSQREALVGQIAAAVTHRIRIPLNALAINLQLLQRSIDSQTLSPEESRQLLATAYPDVDRINQTLEEFIRYTRLPKPRVATVDCNALVQEIAAFLHGRAEEAGVAVTLQLQEDLPSIQADEDQLREALVNLSSNAIEAMPHGGRLRYETSRVADDQRTLVIVRVSDTGAGIPPQTLSRIFEPFFSTKSSGLGLGLAIAQRIAEEHGGAIRCRSEVGVGTTFEVTLPLTAPARPNDQ